MSFTSIPDPLFDFLPSSQFTDFESVSDVMTLVRYGDPEEVSFRGFRVMQKTGDALITIGGLSKRWRWAKSRVHRLLTKLCDEYGFKKVSYGDYIVLTAPQKPKKDGTLNGTLNGTPNEELIQAVTTDGGTANGTANGTDINNKKLNKKNLKKSIVLTDAMKEIVGILNSTCGTSYKEKTKKTQQLIQARIDDGFTIEEFKKVIESRYQDWSKKSDMVQYLRPETLFGSKFEGYLQSVSTNGNLKKHGFIGKGDFRTP